MDIDAGIDRDESDAAPFLDQRGERRIAEAGHHHDGAGNLAFTSSTDLMVSPNSVATSRL